MHVVLSGYYGFDNCGDEAILYSIILALKKIQPEIGITVLSNNPEKTKRTYQVNSVNRRNLMEISTIIRKSDGLISGGGSLLQDVTGPMSIPYYTGIIQLAKFYRKPVFIYAQGMGPIRRKLSKWIVKTTLNKADNITVRDNKSKSLLETLGIRHDARIAPDPVLGIDPTSFKSEWLQDLNITSPFITVSVRTWKEYQSYKHKIAACLDLLVKNDFEIVFVPMHGRHDDEASKEVASLMLHQSYIAPFNASIQEKIAIIGESKLLIGMRLHSLIFSAIRKTPFIALSYDPKIDSFASIYNQPIIGDVIADNWDSDTLYAQVNQVIQNEDIHREYIQSKLQSSKQEAIKTAVDAIQTITSK